MSALAAAPVEVLTHIFRSCSSFSDAISLSSTCRRLSSIWLSDQDLIIWSIGMRSVHAFDYALMAVRATDIVSPAFEAGLLPPDIGSLESLSGVARKPSLAELKKIRDVQHLALCLEYMFFHWRPKHMPEASRGSDWYCNSVALDPKPDSNKRWNGTHPDEWRERFHRATYHLFLAGAAFCRVYNEPFFLHSKFGTSNVDWNSVVQEESDYFKTFPVYNFDVEDDVGEGAVFDAVSRWIVQDTRSKALKECFFADINGPEWLITSESERRLDDPDILGVWEILCMVLANEHMQVKFVAGDIDPPALRQTHSSLRTSADTRTAKVAIFGVFQLEEITMPSCVEETRDIFLVAKRHPETSEPDGSAPFSWDIPGILRSHYDALIESVDESAVPPPLQFITYTLRKYFGLRFLELMFDTAWEEAGYYDFLRDSNLFQKQDNHSCGINFVEMV